MIPLDPATASGPRAAASSAVEAEVSPCCVCERLEDVLRGRAFIREILNMQRAFQRLEAGTERRDEPQGRGPHVLRGEEVDDGSGVAQRGEQVEAGRLTDPGRSVQSTDEVVGGDRQRRVGVLPLLASVTGLCLPCPEHLGAHKRYRVHRRTAEREVRGYLGSPLWHAVNVAVVLLAAYSLAAR